MACGLRRCSGRRGCICPKASPRPLAMAGLAIAAPTPIGAGAHLSEDAGGAEATPEDVIKLFQYFDLDGNGKLGRDELSSVLQSLDATYWSTKRIRALFRAADINRDQFISWEEFLKWVFADGPEQRAVRNALPILDGMRRAEQSTRSGHEAALVAAETASSLAAALEAAGPSFKAGELHEHEMRLQVLQESEHESLLANAESIAALATAIEAAAPVLAPGRMQEHEQRLEAMRRPFSVLVTTLAGVTCTVEATRTQTAASLCQEVAKHVDKKAYRITLAHEGGRLEPPSRTLEECGVTGYMQLQAFFGEQDPLMELSISEFSACLVKYDLATEAQISTFLGSEDDFRSRFKSGLVAAMAAEEQRLRREEELRRRKAEEDERQRKATEERRAALCAEHRARLEVLTFDVLSGQAREAGLVDETEEVMEDRRDVLIQMLTLSNTIGALNDDILALKSKCADDEARCEQLAAVVDAKKEEVQAQLDEVFPALDQCLKALKVIRLENVREVSRINHPSVPLRKTLETFCKIFNLQPTMVADPINPHKKTEDYWPTVQRELPRNAHKFLEDLFMYDKDNIPEMHITHVLAPYVEDEDCSPEAVGKTSAFGEAICFWLRAMYKYHFAARLVRYGRGDLAEESVEYGRAHDLLCREREQLKQRLDDLSYYERELGGLC